MSKKVKIVKVEEINTNNSIDKLIKKANKNPNNNIDKYQKISELASKIDSLKKTDTDLNIDKEQEVPQPIIIETEKIVYVDKIVEVEKVIEKEKYISDIPYMYTDHTNFIKTMRIVNRANKRNFIIELYKDSILYDTYYNDLNNHFKIFNDNILFDSTFNDATIKIYKDKLEIYGRVYDINEIIIEKMK